MASEQALAEALIRIEQAIAGLAQQTSATDARISAGDSNVQSVVTGLELRMAATETKLVGALQAITVSMQAVDQRLASASALPTAMPPPGMEAQAAAATPAAAGGGGAAADAAAAAFDPWPALQQERPKEVRQEVSASHRRCILQAATTW